MVSFFHDQVDLRLALEDLEEPHDWFVRGGVRRRRRERRRLGLRLRSSRRLTVGVLDRAEDLDLCPDHVQPLDGGARLWLLHDLDRHVLARLEPALRQVVPARRGQGGQGKVVEVAKPAQGRACLHVACTTLAKLPVPSFRPNT